MCFGWGCDFEDRDGECRRPRGEDCPMKYSGEDEDEETAYVLHPTHGHPAQESAPGLDYALMDYCEQNLSGGYADV